MLLILQGEPRSTGHIYKTICRGSFPCTYMTPQGKELKADYQQQARIQWREKMLLDDVEIKVKLFFGTRRKCDWDNFHKLSMDSLTGIVWEDDSQIIKATVEKFYDKSDPRIEIEVSPL